MDGKLKAVLIVLSVLCFDLELYAQACNVVSKANDIIPDKLCAPVTVTWDVVYRCVSNGDTANVAMQFNWGDGTAVDTVQASSVVGALVEWRVSHDHIYPIGGSQCNYHPTVALVVGGTVCTSTMQEQTVTVWDVDSENGGRLSVDPPVYPICVGNSGGVTFKDKSRWNCVPPDENDVPNNRKRWIRWIYGTNSADGNFIDNATVGGVMRSYPYVGSVDMTSQPILSPMAPWDEALPVFVPDNRAVGDTFEVTLNNWNYCNPYDQGYDPEISTAVIVVVDNPDGGIVPAGPFCKSDAPVNLNANTGGGQWSGPGIVDEWTGKFDPSSAGVGLHTIHYYVEDGNNCSAEGTIDIRVIDLPAANITAGAEVYLCPGIQLPLDGNPSSGVMPYTHLWTGDVSALNATGIINPEFKAVLEGSYELVYRVTDDNGCFDEDTLSLFVDSVSVRFLNKEVVVCSGVTQALEPNPVGGSGVFVAYQWSGHRVDLLSAADVENPDFTCNVPGLYKYACLVRDSNGCEDTDSIYVRVYQQPVSNAGRDDRVCGLSYRLKAAESAGVGTWSLLSGAGTVVFDEVNNAHTSVKVGAYGDYTFVWTEDNNGCISSSEVTVSFVQVPRPIAMNDADTCGLTYELSAVRDAGAGLWKRIGGSRSVNYANALNPKTQVDVSVSGTYKFAWVEDDNGCVGGDTLVLNFYPVPQVDVLPFDAEQCSPAMVAFNNRSADAETYFWDFGDGGISNQINPVHHFVNHTFDPMDYVVKLTASNAHGCVGAASYDMRVWPAVVAAFQNDEEPGCSPLKLNFINQSEGATTYEWDFGDGNFSGRTNPVHHFVNNTFSSLDYEIKLIASGAYGCKDSCSGYVSVFPKVRASVSDGGAGCTPYSVTLLNNSTGANRFTWYFGDGNESNGFNGRNKYVNSTIEDQRYDVRMIAESPYGCSDTASTGVWVYRRPVPAYSITPLVLQMPQSSITIHNQTPGEAWQYNWQFGDGTRSALKEPGEYVYAVSGEYEVRLKVSGEHCADSLMQIVRVLPTLPLIDYGPDAEGCPPVEVQFYNNTLDAHTYLWDFGDGNVSSEKQPAHTYYTSGNYNVSLVAEGPGGVAEAKGVFVDVYEMPSANFKVRPTVVKLPASTSFINLSEGATSYFWQFGDGRSSTEHSPRYRFENAGIYDVVLQVTNEKGCMDERVIREAVTAKEAGSISFPNAFTPNPSGSSGGAYTPGSSDNDVFYPFVHEGVVEYEMRIYTRWGELIFESRDINIGWDGYCRNKICSGGVYVWKVRCRYTNGSMDVKTGDVTLFR